MKNILILSRYDTLGASSRVRIYQYLPHLASNANFTISPFFSNKIIKDLYKNKRRSILLLCISYIKRLRVLTTIYKYDLIWIEKEALPYFPGFLEMFLLDKTTNYILDYDDAIFHNYDFKSSFLLNKIYSSKFKKLIENANEIFVGNQYLYDFAFQWNKNISFMYSVVDENIFKKINIPQSNIFSIGWIGSPSTTKYLFQIVDILNNFPEKNKFRLITIGASQITNAKFELIQLPWKLEDEVSNINLFDVGIMPLVDNSWEKGKCGFKLIQYMACSIPVIASPVGINREIVTNDVGFLAKNKEEWLYAIKKLMDDKNFRLSLGINARKKIENNFSFYRNVEIFSKLIEKS